MNLDANLHELHQGDGDTTDDERADLEPGANDEVANNDDDDEIIQVLGLANQIFLLGHQLLQGRVRSNPPVPNVVFNLDLYDEAKCEQEFRFHVDEIYDIGAALRLPQIMVLDNDTRFQTIEGLCIVLRRLAYPCRWYDLMHIFGRSEGMLSRMENAVMNWIYRRWSHRLFEWDHARLTPTKLEEFADAVFRAGSPLRRVIGFIDGTLRPIAQPTINQQRNYNGHTRLHALKYQAVTTPDGIIVHLAGAFQGAHNDRQIYQASRLEEVLLQQAKDTRNNQMYLYGDMGYNISPVLIVPHPKQGITPQQTAFNEAMSNVRVAVEWSFGTVIQYFAFSDYKKSQRSLLSEVNVHYIVSILFANIHSCIVETNPSVGRLGVTPPSLEEYLHN